MKIMIVTDAWKPQVNGVVRTLQTTARELQAMGHSVDFLTPLEFSDSAVPDLSRYSPVAVPRPARSCGASRSSTRTRCTSRQKAHWAWQRGAMRCGDGLPFTTAYHTRFPEYIHARTRHAADLDVCFPALVSWTFRGRDGPDRRWSRRIWSRTVSGTS